MRSDIQIDHFDIQSYQELLTDTKGVIRIQRTNTNLQNTSQKTKDRATRTSLKPEVNAGSPEGCAVPALLVAPIVLPRSFQIPNLRNELL
jgi:hypothetical protein